MTAGVVEVWLGEVVVGATAEGTESSWAGATLV